MAGRICILAISIMLCLALVAGVSSATEEADLQPAANESGDQWSSPAAFGVNTFLMGDVAASSEPATNSASAHESYITSTFDCRVCHTIDPTTTDTPELALVPRSYELCDWCHGDGGSASSLYVKTDNDSDLTTEYNVGHTMGYGIDSGKWRAPDDTYPAYVPRYWLGGFSCFDCHNVHANLSRLLGYADDGTTEYPIYSPGHDNVTPAPIPGSTTEYPAGTWMLKKDPDKEVEPDTDSEIPDTDVSARVSVMVGGERYMLPVNKQTIDWNRPESGAFSVSEFCEDCHDGNAGLNSDPAAVYTEEVSSGPSEPNLYCVAMGHDSNEGANQTLHVVNAADQINAGPDCRECHRGSGDCGICHSVKEPAVNSTLQAFEVTMASTDISSTTKGIEDIGVALAIQDPDQPITYTESQTITYVLERGTFVDTIGASVSLWCESNGFNWPHKTVSWKLLKDSMFGVDLDGSSPIVPGQTRNLNSAGSAEPSTVSTGISLSQDQSTTIVAMDILKPAHDLDSVCLDCHNPQIWNPSSNGSLVQQGLP